MYHLVDMQVMLLAESLPTAWKVALERLSTRMEMKMSPQAIMTPEFFAAASVGAAQRSIGPVPSDDYSRGRVHLGLLAIPRLILFAQFCHIN